MKQTKKINESQLRNIIREAISEIDYSNFDFSKTRGIDLSDRSYGCDPKEIKEHILRLQKDIKSFMDILSYCSPTLFDEMWKECYNFYNFISKYYIELKNNYANHEGSWEEDHSDIPFIRKYDDDYGIPNYYDKEGNVVDDKTFRTNFKPHARKINESKIHNAIKESIKKILNEGQEEIQNRAEEALSSIGIEVGSKNIHEIFDELKKTYGLIYHIHSDRDHEMCYWWIENKRGEVLAEYDDIPCGNTECRNKMFWDIIFNMCKLILKNKA